MPRLLIVAPHFAPTNAPDGQRVRLLLPELTRLGWHCTVLCARPEDCAAPIDDGLTATLPENGCEIIRLPARAARWGINNIGIRLMPALRRSFAELTARTRFDLVYFSTTQFACLKLGFDCRDRNLPFVVDLQDPWLSDYYERPGAPPPPGGWKYRFARWSAQRDEPRVMRICAHVVSVSPEYLTTLQSRYPWFHSDRGTVIPFGWSLHDQKVARELAGLPAPTPVIRYAGRVGDDMESLLEDLLIRFRNWLHRDENRGSNLRWEFQGTSYANERGGGVVHRVAERLGLQSHVTENPQRVGYLQSLRASQNAWANLVLGSDDLAYSPSKTWPVLATGRPWLAWIHPDSVIARQIPDARDRDHLRLDSVNDNRFENWLSRLVRDRFPDHPPPPEIDHLSNHRLALCHVQIFEGLIRAQPSS